MRDMCVTRGYKRLSCIGMTQNSSYQRIWYNYKWWSCIRSHYSCERIQSFVCLTCGYNYSRCDNHLYSDTESNNVQIQIFDMEHVRIQLFVWAHTIIDTGWRRLIGCLDFIGHFPHTSPVVIGSFAGKDLQLEAAYASLPPCMHGDTIILCMTWAWLSSSICVYTWICVYIWTYHMNTHTDAWHVSSICVHAWHDVTHMYVYACDIFVSQMYVCIRMICSYAYTCMCMQVICSSRTCMCIHMICSYVYKRHVRDSAHPYVYTHEYVYAYEHIIWVHTHVRDFSHSYVHMYSYVYTHMDPSVWHVVLICVTWRLPMCDMAHVYVRHASFLCATWPIHMRDVTTCYLRHGTFCAP